MSEKDTSKKKYEHMEAQGRKKPRVWALHIAGRKNEEIANRLSIAPALVDLWTKQLRDAVRNAEVER